MSNEIILSNQGKHIIGSSVGSNSIISTPLNDPLTGLFFSSVWNTGAGTSDANVRDTGRNRPWSVRNSTGWEVRNTLTDGRDYPTTNYLRLNAASAQMVLAFQDTDSYVNRPGVGDSIYGRMYFRYMLTGSHSPGDGSSHGNYHDEDWADSSNWGPQALGFGMDHIDESTFRLHIHTATFGDVGNWYQWRHTGDGVLNKSTTYRIEWKYIRTGTDSFKVAIRIYNISNTLLYNSENGDFVGTLSGGNLGTSLNDKTFTGPFTYNQIANVGQAESVRGFQIGCESQQGTVGDIFNEFAAIGFSTSYWLGPFNSAETNL